jgi:fucose permease
MNASWCAGAVAGPPIILRTLATHPLTNVLAWLALVLALMAGYFLLRPETVGSKPDPAISGPVPLKQILMLTCCFLFLYVGMENGVNGWLVSYGLRARGMRIPAVAYSHAVFWAAILIGRLLAAFGSAGMRDSRLIWGGILTALAGTALFVASVNGVLYFAGVFLAGFGMSAIFPTAISVFMRRGGAYAQRGAGLVFACASLGGAAVPWIMGRVSTWLHDLQPAMWILTACGALMLALQSWMEANASRNPHRSGQD